jgi:hypothetical protein
MAINIVIGGHSRNIGKTSVVAGIIHDLADLNWTAVKITQFGHGICSINGRNCHCSTDEHRFMIQEEKTASENTDTSRFLAAGARKSLWVRTKQGMLFEALPALRKQIAGDPFVILESNSIIRFMKPDLYLVVLDYSVQDFKASAQKYLDRADAFIVFQNETGIPIWRNISLKPLFRKPVFELPRGVYKSVKISEFVRDTAEAAAGS